MGMDPLSSILPKVLHKRGLHGQMQAAHVVFKAQEWLGAALPGVKAYLSVRTFRDGVLMVECQNAVASQECLPLLPSLREYLERECKGARVREVRLVRAEGRKSGLAPSPEAP